MRKFADWSKAPEWANYHTVDKSGVGCWWENSPSTGCWNWNAEAGEVKVSEHFFLAGVDWENTLEARPNDAGVTEERRGMMRKFAEDWSKAPEWANYHTVDKSGVGCWWENSPTRDCGMWGANKGKTAVSGFFNLGSVAWDDTLEARPTEVEHLLVGAGGGRGSGSTTSLNGGPATEGSDLTPGGASDGVVHENYFLAADSGGAGGSPRYGSLRRVLDLAYDQSAKGKGKERHANDKTFDEQPIMQISRMVGLGFPCGQVQKKVQEAGGMVAAGRPEAAQAELLGAIVYCAAAWLLIEESK